MTQTVRSRKLLLACRVSASVRHLLSTTAAGFLVAVSSIILAACSAASAPAAATAATATATATATSQSESAPTAPATAIPEPSGPEEPARESLTVPLTLHLVSERGVPESELSSQRTASELDEIVDRMRVIWAQADVIFDPVNINELEIPTNVLQGIAFGDTSPFFAEVNATFVPEDARAINGFYVRSAFGVNGFTPQGSNLFFVVDEPSVNDERVSSHELGHIFGLHHDLGNPAQLMFSGTNGTGLSAIEQTVARYTINGIFPQGTP